MSSEEFVTQKKSKGKKKVISQPEVELTKATLKSQFEVLAELEPLEMPVPIQTKPKKISPLIRNAIKSQPDELNFKKPDSSKVDLSGDKLNNIDEDSENDQDDVTTEEESDEGETYENCPGCYYCNWTGLNNDNKQDCKRHYYGDVN
jgi:hypothetical protein